MNEQVIGASVRRKEDFRFLTGAGNYTDDINRPGQLYAYILRSPHAHAEIAGIDTSKAGAAPGVSAVFTGAEVQVGGLPCGWLVNSKDGSPMVEPPHPVLAAGKVRPGGSRDCRHARAGEGRCRAHRGLVQSAAGRRRG